MKLVSFSLWGTDPKYTVGALRNAALVKEIYPGWTMILYLDHSVENGIRNQLAEAGVLLRNPPCANGFFWRFFAVCEDDCEYALIRDADSRLNHREARAVEEWLRSGRRFHVMRDHPYHTVPIMGGMWGAAGGAIAAAQIHADPRAALTGDRARLIQSDQDFLRDRIWPEARLSCLEHDWRQGTFPPDGPRYVGEVFDAGDRVDPEGWRMREACSPYADVPHADEISPGDVS